MRKSTYCYYYIVYLLLFGNLAWSNIERKDESDDDEFEGEIGQQLYLNDLEVVLSSEVVLAPDVVISHFVDNNSLEESLEKELLSLSEDENEEENEGVGTLRRRANSTASSSSTTNLKLRLRTNDNESTDTEKLAQDFPRASDSSSRGFGMRTSSRSSSKSTSHTMTITRSGPGGVTYTKINSTKGTLSLNFHRDSTLLLVSPIRNSRLVLTCDPIPLPNCSRLLIGKEKLVINNAGDLGFGRNSYKYCSVSIIRMTSIRRRISIHIVKEPRITGNFTCRYITRAQTFFEESSQFCGKLTERAPKIVGGKKLAHDQLFPYIAQLDIMKMSGSHTTCSASLVSGKLVLTAAHCLRGVKSITVYLGGINRNIFTGNEILIQAEKFILHRNWNSRTLLADIALVVLSKKVKFTNEISPVCLPNKSLRNENLQNKKGVAVGWGRTSTLRKSNRIAYRVPLPFLSDFRCFLAYKKFFIPKIMICTESSLEKAICYGDSGGPLLIRRNSKVYQIGISSYSSSMTCGESYDVFTRLDDHYVEWIRTKIFLES